MNRSRLKELLSNAAVLDPPSRQALLDEIGTQDQSMRRELERLLAVVDNSGPLDKSHVLDWLEIGSAPATFQADDRVGRFRVVRLIGIGGMGEVYEVEDTEFGGRLALKTIRAELSGRSDFISRFQREIQLARQVSHPNLCRVMDVGRHSAAGAQVFFLTMELLEGETLQERISNRVLDRKETGNLVRQVAAGIAALHQAGIIHRDLKPANILLVRSVASERAVVTDFGLAHRIVDSPDQDSLTKAGQIVGTPDYMSPEQLSGKPVGPSSDIYSLGMVMYEMVCRRRPFQDPNLILASNKKLAGPPPPPSSICRVPPALDRLILDCLQPDPAKRPRDIASFLTRLDSAIADRPWPLETPWVWPFVQHRWLRYAAAATACVAPLALSRWQPPTRAELCRKMPGNEMFCVLPVNKDAAVFPFSVKASGLEDKALAEGLAQYVRDSYARLSLSSADRCVHLRNDRRADGVSLALDGSVEVTGERLTLSLRVLEAQSAPGAVEPSILRQGEITVARSSAERLHAESVGLAAQLFDTPIRPDMWEKWEASGPRYAESFLAFLRGIGAVQARRYEDAAREFTAATDPAKDFAFAPAQVGLGTAYTMLLNRTNDGTYALRARQAFRRAAPLDRDFGFARAEQYWGEFERAAGDIAASVEHLQNSHSLAPTDDQVYRALAGAYEATGSKSRAEALLRSVVQQTPRCWLAHNTLADFYSRQSRFADAEKVLLEVIKLAPRNPVAYHNLAFDYIKMGRYQDAAYMASRAISLRPSPMTYSTLGRAYLHRKCTSDALANLRRAVEMDPQSYVLWANLAEALHRLGSAADAAAASVRTVELARATLERTPNVLYARAQLALNLARLGRKHEAISQAETALRQAAGSHDILLLVAETYEHAGSRNRALPILADALGSGLTIRQIESVMALAQLRQDPRYGRVLKRLGLAPPRDPGDLTPESSTPCPGSQTPNVG